MKPLRSGQLRHPITIRRAVETPDGKGGYTSAWHTIAACRAEIETLDGRESVMERVLEGVSSYRIRIRWRAGLDIRASDQAVLPAGFHARELNIKAPAGDPDGRRRWLVFIADTASARPDLSS